MPAPIVFVGGVTVSFACLEALCEMGLPPALAVGYSKARSDAAGFADLGHLAERYEIELMRTADVNDTEVVQCIEKLKPALVYVIGWSQLVHPRLLGVPTNGCVGIHPTRLPEGRGRAPIPWTILKAFDRTASTMFFLSEGTDDGDVIGRIEFQIDDRESAATLYQKHLAAHVELIRCYTTPLLEGTAPRLPQDHAQATVWPRRRPEDGLVDWSRSAETIDRLVRAVTRPYPGAFTETPAGRITIWQAEPGPSFDRPPGHWIRRGGDVFVACGDGSLRVLEAEGPVEVALRHGGGNRSNRR